MLDDISAVKTWDKVNEGMIKMYLAEVLGKLPVIQHFLFGSILQYDGPILATNPTMDDSHGHVHLPGDIDGNWGDCCGIPVPSAFAEAATNKKRWLEGPHVRPVPFD